MTHTILNIIRKDRKFFLALFALCLTFIEGIVSALMTKFSLDAILIANGTIIGGYLGANIVQKKWVENNGKNNRDTD